VSAARVLRVGGIATVQDLGRWGHQALGVPVCGAMDTWSHRLANRLVGNASGAATIELSAGALELIFSDVRVVAVAGAALGIQVDTRRLSSPAVFTVRPGGRVTIAPPTRGSRAYLAVSGGFDVPLVLGSRATDLRARFGGLDGRALVADDALPLGGRAAAATARADAQFPVAAWVPPPGQTTILRALLADVAGLEPVQRAITAGTWTVSSASDRMGYRLEGPSLAPAIADVLTMPTAIGSIQVPPSGQPILLMADRQTTGGYLQPAAVIAADIPVAAQLAPGDRLQFVACTFDEARAALVERESPFATEAC
jgi:antagonist of KipI